MHRSVLQAKQDAQEQKAKSDWLTFRGPHVVIEYTDTNCVINQASQDASTVSLDRKLARHIAGMISKRVDIDVDVQNGDITYVGIREANENHPKFILVRFQQQSMRDAIWKKRKEAKKNGMIIEEWLTDIRARLYKKCKELKFAKIIKDVITENGDIYAVLLNALKDIPGQIDEHQEKSLVPNTEDTQELTEKTDKKNAIHQEPQNISLVKKVVISDADYENLVKHTKNAKTNPEENSFA